MKVSKLNFAEILSASEASAQTSWPRTLPLDPRSQWPRIYACNRDRHDNPYPYYDPPFCRPWTYSLVQMKHQQVVENVILFTALLYACRYIPSRYVPTSDRHARASRLNKCHSTMRSFVTWSPPRVVPLRLADGLPTRAAQTKRSGVNCNERVICNINILS